MLYPHHLFIVFICIKRTWQHKTLNPHYVITQLCLCNSQRLQTSFINYLALALYPGIILLIVWIRPFRLPYDKRPNADNEYTEPDVNHILQKRTNDEEHSTTDKRNF